MIIFSWGLYYRTFCGRNLQIFVISQCLSLASFSSLILCLHLMPEPARVKHLSSSTLGQAPGLAPKHQTRLERLTRDKHSSLLQKYVNYDRKSFIVQTPGQSEPIRRIASHSTYREWTAIPPNAILKKVLDFCVKKTVTEGNVKELIHNL